MRQQFSSTIMPQFRRLLEKRALLPVSQLACARHGDSLMENLNRTLNQKEEKEEDMFSH
jgi:hypothetical protein